MTSRAGAIALDLFDVRVPDVRTPAPSAPGSESSRAGSRNVRPRRGNQYAKILAVLADRTEPTSREHLAALTGISQTSLCARLSELAPIWVTCVEGVCVSRAGVRVNGYQATTAGAQRVRRAACG